MPWNRAIAGNHRFQRRPRIDVFEVVSRSRGPAEPSRYATEVDLLTKRQWLLLDRLADQDEPLECAYNAYADGDRSIDPRRMLDDILLLVQRGLITIRQEPISALQQTFKTKTITPKSASEIVGDLTDDFENFCVKRDYLHYATLGEGPNATAGVPFGIWIDMTTAGRREWNDAKYEPYYPDQIA